MGWFEKNKRAMPWREDASPYRILVSEVMLQQTQVVTVIPYFHRFMHAFPTVGDLAAAPEEQILKLWEGLGYYSRARHLHACAKAIVDLGGEIPDEFDELKKLPGGRASATIRRRPSRASVSGGKCRSSTATCCASGRE